MNSIFKHSTLCFFYIHICYMYFYLSRLWRKMLGILWPFYRLLRPGNVTLDVRSYKSLAAYVLSHGKRLSATLPLIKFNQS